MLSEKLPVEYASFNIDTASFHYQIDLKDVRLRNIVKQITAPGAWMRIGGTASGGVCFTGPNGPRNACNVGGKNICINTQFWDEIADFVEYTGVRLLFDFSDHWFDANGDWDPAQNVTAQLAYTASKGYGKNWAWQFGNEALDGHTGTQWGQYFVRLNKAVAQFPGIGQTINGASSSVNGDTAVEFLKASLGYLDIYSYHAYGPDVDPFNFNNIKGNRPCAGTRAMVDANAPGVKLSLEESACHPLGGHDGYCNRFVSGYYYIHTLAAAAESGCHYLHRQDVMGYSFVGLGSSYALAGPPGWVNNSQGSLNPHPDWYTLVLWKQLVGFMPLGNVKATGVAGEVADFDPHVWCGSKNGTVVLTYASGHSTNIQITSLSGVSITPRTEYFLTAPTLTADEIDLNGVKMTVGDDAMLPQYPVPGKTATTSPIVIPPMSYGFVVFNADVPGCA
jgi:hypothetical protein